MERNDLQEKQILVGGKVFTNLPTDLFIPPDALEVLLDSFSGPLDLLLYLIRKQDIDILDIPIMQITEQYLHYIQMMECQKMELAAEYLLMAAMLAEIKSRLLLPVSPSEEEQEEDPRMVLVRRLQAYEQIKNAAENLNVCSRLERDHYLLEVQVLVMEEAKIYPEVDLQELIVAMKLILSRQDQCKEHQITKEALSVRERMNLILTKVADKKMVSLQQLFTSEEGRAGLIVTFLAILELARQSLIFISQQDSFSSIYLQSA